MGASDIPTHALRLAGRGFPVFPVRADATKKPLHTGWQKEATTDPVKVRALFQGGGCNVGIYTGHTARPLLVVDVDNKNGKSGDETLTRLELEGKDFPPTYEQRTPTGGRHLAYSVDVPVKQGANVLGPGLDIRSRGGYIVGSGSTINGAAYTDNGADVAPAPAWLVDACGAADDNEVQRTPAAAADMPQERAEAAERRARHYLADEAPVGEAGSRNETGYKVAARLRDFGVASKDECTALMREHWKCSPPLEDDELEHVCNSAYTYAKDTPGNADPAQQFGPVSAPADGATDPVAKLNEQHAFVTESSGHYILFETTDADGQHTLMFLPPATFHARYAAEKIQYGKGEAQITDLWLKWKGRRSYDGLVFRPEQPTSPRFYNVWRGFGVQAAATGQSAAVDAYVEHLHQNVCRGIDALFRWLWQWLAHLVQKPWEKPHTAIVLRGGKGVGKNAAVAPFAALLGQHFFLTANKRYLLSNFNGHLEGKLMLVLDEAYWSGDKASEGILKDLVTGDTHNIERKGREPYKSSNLTRVVILGNEAWLVPASHDERRYAVFDVSDARRQDTKFFGRIARGMQNGGHAALLRRLRDADIGDFDPNVAPDSDGLRDQKIASLPSVAKWLFECLQSGHMNHAQWTDAGLEISKDDARSTYARWSALQREHHPADRSRWGETLVKILGRALLREGQPRIGTERRRVLYFGGLSECQVAFERHLGGGKIDWESADEIAR